MIIFSFAIYSNTNFNGYRCFADVVMSCWHNKISTDMTGEFATDVSYHVISG